MAPDQRWSASEKITFFAFLIVALIFASAFWLSRDTTEAKYTDMSCTTGDCSWMYELEESP